MSMRPADTSEPNRELPIEELKRRARPLPPHEEMVIEDLSEDEGAAFLTAVKS
jgi:hypothetical protein